MVMVSGPEMVCGLVSEPPVELLPVVELPVVELPVVELPVVELPVVELPVVSFCAAIVKESF